MAGDDVETSLALPPSLFISLARAPSLPPSSSPLLELPPSLPLHLPRSTLLQQFRSWPSPAAFNVSRLAAPPIVSLNLEQSPAHIGQVRLPSSRFDVSIISPPSSPSSLPRRLPRRLPLRPLSLPRLSPLPPSFLPRRLPLPPSSLPHHDRLWTRRVRRKSKKSKWSSSSPLSPSHSSHCFSLCFSLSLHLPSAFLSSPPASLIPPPSSPPASLIPPPSQIIACTIDNL